mgnify:FL=1
MEKIKDENLNKRYFLVNYVADGDCAIHRRIGTFNCVIRDGYLNRKELFKIMDKQFGIKNPAILSIIELSESDYNDFIKE